MIVLNHILFVCDLYIRHRKSFRLSGRRGEKILLLAYARSCQHMGESETAINAAPRAVSELRKSNFIPRELSSFLKESVKTAHFNLIAASL